jgi:hypothetical protein
MNIAFSKEEVQMARKTHEEMFNIPGHKGNAVKTILRFYLTPVRMENTNNNQCW